MDMVDDETGGEYSLWLFNFAFAATSGVQKLFMFCFFLTDPTLTLLLIICDSDNCGWNSCRKMSDEILSFL